jgi:thioredoxin reductase (NADPH)
MEQEKENCYDVVVIGGGPAGLIAALYLARARYRALVVEKDHLGGQITITAEVVNYPRVERISGRALTESMRRQAQRFGVEFLLMDYFLQCSAYFHKISLMPGNRPIRQQTRIELFRNLNF